MADGWWDGLYRKARSLEGQLEKKIQAYSSLSQRINANFLCDEENPLMEGDEEQSLSTDIERDLSELYDCIQRMKQGNGVPLSNQQETWVKRYYEIHFDYSSEFRNTSVLSLLFALLFAFILDTDIHPEEA